MELSSNESRKKQKGLHEILSKVSFGLKFFIVDNFFCLLSSTVTNSPVSGF